MIHCTRTNATDAAFHALVALLDEDLTVRNGEEQAFFTPFNTLDAIKHVIVAYEDNMPVGCGAVKEYAPGVMEVKRMFVLQEKRGRGIAAQILNELERWSREMNYKHCILETGRKQVEAIALYHKHGYAVICNYGQYAGVESSVCFRKDL